jgi:hypothetical protein
MSDQRPGARTLLQEIREPGRNYALYADERLVALNVDGIAGIRSSGVLSHLDFFIVDNIQSDPDPELGLRETRSVRVRVTMPTVQLLEGYANLLTLLQQQLDVVQSGADANAQAVAAQVARLKAMKA